MPCGYCGKEGPPGVSIGVSGVEQDFCSMDHFSLYVKRIRKTVKRLPVRENKPVRRRCNAKTPNA